MEISLILYATVIAGTQFLNMLSFKEQSKILQDLLNNPANSTCADCSALSPRWASLNFGVFICSSCAGGHRALGPTITRVKSVHLDSWQRAWAEDMVIGNQKLNAFWQGLSGANDRKPRFGAQMWEYDRFVHDKYKKKRFVQDQSMQDPLTRLKSGLPLPRNQVPVESRVETKVESRVQSAKPVAVAPQTKKQMEVTVASQPKSASKKECVDLMDFSDPVVTNNGEEFASLIDGSKGVPKAQNFMSFDRLVFESTKSTPVVHQAYHGQFPLGIHHNGYHIPQHQLPWGMQVTMMPHSY